jgi:hypothetical protein
MASDPRTGPVKVNRNDRRRSRQAGYLHALKCRTFPLGPYAGAALTDDRKVRTSPSVS